MGEMSEARRAEERWRRAALSKQLCVVRFLFSVYSLFYQLNTQTHTHTHCWDRKLSVCQFSVNTQFSQSGIFHCRIIKTDSNSAAFSLLVQIIKASWHRTQPSISHFQFSTSNMLWNNDTKFRIFHKRTCRVTFIHTELLRFSRKVILKICRSTVKNSHVELVLMFLNKKRKKGKFGVH